MSKTPEEIFANNPDIRKVVTAEGMYWRTRQDYESDPDRQKDTRATFTFMGEEILNPEAQRVIMGERYLEYLRG